MRYLIRHLTRYRYKRPVRLEPHRLMLFPRGNQLLRVIHNSLACTPDATLEWTQDVFGNLIATAEFAEPVAELVIESDMEVDQVAAEWPVFPIAAYAQSWPFAYAAGDSIDLGALLVPDHDDPGGVLGSWARRFVRSEPTDTLSLLQDLNSGILDFVLYRTREEEGTQSPLETLRIGSGSCRDIAALFIDSVRQLGIGARAVSGYLCDSGPGPGDGGSTHAWAEIYLPCAGWIAFDPTHRRMGSANLIPVAVARRNDQTAPVVGGYVGSPEDYLGMDVRVEVSRIVEAAA